MCVLPTQAASLDQFWRKMRHWQIKWSIVLKHILRNVKWNKFPKHVRDQLEVIQPDWHNSKRITTLVGIVKIRAAIIIIIFFFLVSSYTSSKSHALWPQIMKHQMIYWSEHSLQITCTIVSSPCHYCPMMSWAQKVGKVPQGCLFHYEFTGILVAIYRRLIRGYRFLAHWLHGQLTDLNVNFMCLVF